MRILFVCVHNSGRSQMAEAYLGRFARERGFDVTAESAGTLGAGHLNPVVAEAMAEDGVPLDGHFPKRLTQDAADRADRVVSMGCGVDAAACPATFLVTEDWGIDDPAGLPIGQVRPIRDEVKRRVLALLDSLSGA